MEQQAQMAAPHKRYQWLAQTVSNVCHPLLMLTLVAIICCYFTPLEVLPLKLKLFFIVEVAFYTLVLPALIITLLHVFHIIGHWALRDRRDRMIPFLTNFVCYGTCAVVLTRNHFLPDWVLMAYYSSALLTFVAWIISFWWKISAHASADAAVVAYIIFLAQYVPIYIPTWLILVPLILLGLVCSSRIYLGRHTLAQVGVGAALGFGVIGISLSIFNF